MADSTVYAIDEGGNRIPTLSAEKINEAIQIAIKTGEIPAELQTFIDTIREQNNGAGLKFWLGTQAEFLALESTSEDVIYFINDSTNLRDVADALAKLSEQLKDGSFKVKKAEAADSAANVSEKINSKAVTEIFESDGVTAKTATNVKGNINGKAITSIFESDGVTAKTATNADNAKTINKYQHNIGFDISDGSHFGRIRVSFVSSYENPIEYDGEIIKTMEEYVDVPIMATGWVRVGTAGFFVPDCIQINSTEGCIIVAGFRFNYYNDTYQEKYEIETYQDDVTGWVDRVIKL